MNVVLTIKYHVMVLGNPFAGDALGGRLAGFTDQTILGPARCLHARQPFHQISLIARRRPVAEQRRSLGHPCPPAAELSHLLDRRLRSV